MREMTLEVRDTEIAIAFWKQKAEQFGELPPIAEFSLTDFVTQPFRFMILADLMVSDDSVFLAYGPGFAKLLDLPVRPSMLVPMLKCLPDRYRPLFAEGCDEATSEASPIRLDGEVARAGGSELYRACFMPLKMNIVTMRAVYGSFNFRFRTTAELAERPQTEAAYGAAHPKQLGPAKRT
jgi:hypothetical protein